MAEALDTDNIQTLFENFLTEFQENNVLKYVNAAIMYQYSEKNAFIINYDDVFSYNQNLALKIIGEFQNVYPFLKKAILNQISKFTRYDDRDELQNKMFYISFLNVPNVCKINQIVEDNVGQLIKVSGKVVNELYMSSSLIKEAYVCEECNTINKDIDMSFMNYCPKICYNVGCRNKTNFKSSSNEIIHASFRNVLIQDDPPVTFGHKKILEVIVKDELMDIIQDGCSYDFIGVQLKVLQAQSPEDLFEVAKHRNDDIINVVFFIISVLSKSGEEKYKRKRLGTRNSTVGYTPDDSVPSTSRASSSSTSTSVGCIGDRN